MNRMSDKKEEKKGSKEKTVHCRFVSFLSRVPMDLCWVLSRRKLRRDLRISAPHVYADPCSFFGLYTRLKD